MRNRGYKSMEGLANPECNKGFGADGVMRQVSPHSESAMRKMAMDGHFPTLLAANVVSLVRNAL